MARIDNLKKNELATVVNRVRRTETTAPLGSTSVHNGRTRFVGSNSLVVEGSSLTSGTASITGTQTVSGTANNSGTVNNSGVVNNSGSINNIGTSTNTGQTNLNGAVSVIGTVTVSGGGAVTVSGSTPATLGITSLGTPGLQIGSTSISSIAGAIGMVAGSNSIVVGSASAVMTAGSRSLTVNSTRTQVQGPFDVVGAITGTSKSFKIPHPTKPDMFLLHGVTESPVHGVEYWGEEVIGDDGNCRVDLPEYFEALTELDGRAVLVTGRGHSPDWSDIDGAHFTVTGDPGKRFSWLVKASRSDVTLVNEEPMMSETGSGADEDDGTGSDIPV